MDFKWFVIKSICTILIIAFLTSTGSHATDRNQCDSIIKRGVELMQKKQHVKSLELLINARTMAEQHDWYKQLFLAQNNIGNNYYMLLDYGEALHQYLLSYTIATEFLDDQHEMIVLNNIAVVYSKEKEFVKANEYFHKAYVIANQHKDSLKIALYSMNLGALANDEHHLEKARTYLEKALIYTQRPEVTIPAQIGLCFNDLLAGNHLKARTKAFELLPTVDQEEHQDQRTELLTLIAKSFLEDNDLTQALQWTNTALEVQPNLETKIELFQYLSDIYFRLKSYNLAIQYRDSITISNNQLNTIKNGKLYESSEVKFQIQNYKEKLTEKEAKLKRERTMFYSVILAILFGIVLLVLIFKNQLTKNKQKALISQREQELVSLELEKEMADNALLLEKERSALLEQERLQSEIELKNQKILSKTIYQSGRNELLKDVLESLSNVPQLAQNGDLIENIQALKAHLKTDDDWSQYIRHFDAVNQGFIKKLTDKHPNLTTTDIRYISYVFMNLDTKEIATMLNITPAACRKRKERIEKRLQVPKGMSLNAYLLSI